MELKDGDVVVPDNKEFCIHLVPETVSYIGDGYNLYWTRSFFHASMIAKDDYTVIRKEDWERVGNWTSGAPDFKWSCSCDMRDLLMQGCQCGGI